MPRQLRIVSVEASFGELGPRKTSNIVYPREELCLRYYVTEAAVGPDGSAEVKIDLVLRSADGNLLRHTSSIVRSVISCGKNKFPAFAKLEFPPDVVPGENVVTIKVTDKTNGSSDTFDYPVVTKPVSNLTIINPRFFFDESGTIPASCGPCVSQTLYFRASLLGIDQSRGTIRARMSTQVVDRQTDEEMMPRAFGFRVSAEDEAIKQALNPTADFNCFLSLTRPGKFHLIVEMSDEITTETLRYKTDLDVVPPPGWDLHMVEL